VRGRRPASCSSPARTRCTDSSRAAATCIATAPTISGRRAGRVSAAGRVLRGDAHQLNLVPRRRSHRRLPNRRCVARPPPRRHRHRDRPRAPPEVRVGPGLTYLGELSRRPRDLRSAT
jgi:hypothetical protein